MKKTKKRIIVGRPVNLRKEFDPVLWVFAGIMCAVAIVVVIDFIIRSFK